MSRTRHFTRESTRGPAAQPRQEGREFRAEGPSDALESRRRAGSRFAARADWQRVGIFGAGLALGLAAGAGAALLFAPQSGEDTRELLGEQAREMRGRVVDRWEDLRYELRAAARRGKKRVRRGVTRGRWAAEDVVERRRPRRWR